MASLRKRKSRVTGEDLCEVVPTSDQVIENRGTCEYSEEFLRSFLANVQHIVTSCIDKFFEGRQMHCGGEISADHLHCPAYVSMVMNYSVGKSVDVAYAALDRENAIAYEDLGITGKEEADDDADIREEFVIMMLQSCAPMGIPKCFAGGILLMYMELCLGVDLREPLLALGNAA